MARQKAIPIFAFADRHVQALIPTWHSNPDADFSKTVDTPRVFEFIERVGSQDSVWMRPFETAQEITKSLQIQFAYLFMGGLQSRLRLRNASAAIDALRGEALRIALDKPKGWEGLLFAQLISDEIAAAADQRRNFEQAIAIGSGDFVESSVVGQWLGGKMQEVVQLGEAFQRVLNTSLNTALAASDIDVISYAARQVGRCYVAALDWAERIRCTALPDQWQQAAEEAARLMVIFLAPLESAGPQIRDGLQAALAEGRTEVAVTVTIPRPEIEPLNREIERIRRELEGR